MMFLTFARSVTAYNSSGQVRQSGEFCNIFIFVLLHVNVANKQTNAEAQGEIVKNLGLFICTCRQFK